MSHTGAAGFVWAPPADALRCRAQMTTIIVHRIAVSGEDAAASDTIEDTLAFFCRHPVGIAATGGAMPYPLLVDAWGHIWQSQRLLALTPHAARYNAQALGVAAVGDFRERSPSPPQRRALVELLAHLLDAMALPEGAIRGHDELPGASRQPDKICPGAHMPLPALRAAVADRRARGPVWLELAW